MNRDIDEVESERSKPSFVIKKSGEVLNRRSERSFDLTYEQSQPYLFLNEMHSIDKRRDRDVTSFFVRRSINLTFFDSLSFTELSIASNTHLRAAEGPRQQGRHQERSVQGIDREEEGLENTHKSESVQETVQESRSLRNDEISFQNHSLNQISHHEENIRRLKTYHDRSERDSEASSIIALSYYSTENKELQVSFLN